jgi:hypothetical protein
MLISRILNRLFYSLITSSNNPARGRCTTTLILNILDIPKFSLIILAIYCRIESSSSSEDPSDSSSRAEVYSSSRGSSPSELSLLTFSSRNRLVSFPLLAIAIIRLSIPVLLAI